MIKYLILITLTTAAFASEQTIALVNFASIDAYGDMLLMRTERGIALNKQKTEIDIKDAEYKRVNKVDNITPYLSETCAINAAIDSEKKILLDAYIKRALGDRYAIVISDSSCLLYKAKNIIIVDVSLDIIDAINADKSLIGK